MFRISWSSESIIFGLREKILAKYLHKATR